MQSRFPVVVLLEAANGLASSTQQHGEGGGAEGVGCAVGAGQGLAIHEERACFMGGAEHCVFVVHGDG